MKTALWIQRAGGLVLIVLGLTAGEVRADTLTWTAGTSDWHAVQNWTNWAEPAATRVPAGGDTAVVTNAGARVLLAQSSAYLGALVISNAAVSCSNWVTTLYATNLTILKGGLLTCEGPFTNNGMSNRVCVTCSTLRIEANGAVNVDGKGYAGGAGGYGDGYGPGGGGLLSGGGKAANEGYFFGGSYGGAGRNGQNKSGRIIGQNLTSFLATNTYGSAMAPLIPGSGGNGPNQTTSGNIGGCGGGAVCITAVQAIVNGRMSANGTKPVGYSHGGGGSGGGIYITCSTLAGTNGSITVDAGASEGSLGGGGGGGRIAVVYDPDAQHALPVPSVTFSAKPSQCGSSALYRPGDIGTLWFPDAYFFSPANLFTGQWMAPAPSELCLDDWTVSNVWIRLPGINLTVTNTLAIAGTNCWGCKLEFTNAATIRCGQVRVSGASLIVGEAFLDLTGIAQNPFPEGVLGSTLTVAGDLILTNAARFYVYAGRTNAGAPAEVGARVDVGNNLLIATNCWILPSSHPTNGAVPVFSMRNLTIASGGGFNADARGYSGGKGVYGAASSMAYGKGAPTEWAAGAGYGGAGSLGYLTGGVPGGTYGSTNAPTEPGSGAKAATSVFKYGPYGGGSVQIRAGKTVTLLGAITANGGSGEDYYGGGASGGGIYITCRTFIGTSNALLQANGGSGAGIPGGYGGGGGGGGRIAVWRVRDLSPSAVSNSVSGGLGKLGSTSTTNAAPGTFILDWLPADGTLLQFQ